MMARGVLVTYETKQQWCRCSGPLPVRRRAGRVRPPLVFSDVHEGQVVGSDPQAAGLVGRPAVVGDQLLVGENADLLQGVVDCPAAPEVGGALEAGEDELVDLVGRQTRARPPPKRRAPTSSATARSAGKSIVRG